MADREASEGRFGEDEVKGCPFVGLRGNPCFPPLCRLAIDGVCVFILMADAMEETRDMLKEMRDEG